MCGIAGIISKNPLSSENRHKAKRMQNALVHRGPDDEGVFSDSHLVLTHRRLSIIDLKKGKQPLYSFDGSCVLVANGEIYNYIELREQLKAQGYRFSTNSDCEVIIYLYKQYGIKCLEHLRGMFAFALWDKNKKLVILARDRMGEKPLYLYEKDGTIFFSSEIKSLLKSGLIPFELDPISVNEFFHYQYVPEPKTILKGVRKLPAGHYMVIDLDKGSVVQKCYWRMQDAPPLEGDPGTLISEELERISKIIIRSDVPVGVALSGGLDSSTIAALAARECPDAMHAFCIGYPDSPDCDERNDAKAFADHIGLPFHDVEISTNEMINSFADLIFWQDDPIAEICAYGNYMIMKTARECNIPVILHGQGGDELFWGYPWASDAVRESFLKSRYNFTISFFDFLNTKISPIDDWSLKGLARWGLSLAGLNEGWKRFKRIRSMPRERLVFYDVLPDYWLAMNSVWGIYSTQFQGQISDTNPSDLFNLPIPWKQIDIEITNLICQTFLLEDGIAQVDRLSMTSSVETRLPLIDHKLVETVIGLRKTRPDYNLPPKIWLKSAIKDMLPEWVLNRPKRGFAPPLNEWYEQLFLKYGALIKGGYLQQKGILSERSVHDLSLGPFPRGYNVTPISFKALVLEMWCRKMQGSKDNVLL